MSSEGSVAPKERVNIVYKSASGDAKEDIELPFKQLVIGDFTLREESQPVDERSPVNVDKDSFNDVLKAHNLSLTMAIPNKLAGEESDERLAMELKFDSIRDFEPDALVEQVPELKQLVALRDALKSLKGPLGNLPDFRKQLQQLIQSDDTRAKLLAELGVKDHGKDAS